jgi:type VI secretion system secreted protein VgrG
LTLSPILAFLGLRPDACIFQAKEALGVCEELFKNYPQAQVRYQITQPLAQRAICTQYAESALAVLTRLLAEGGLSWHSKHAQASLDAKLAYTASSTGVSSYKNRSIKHGTLPLPQTLPGDL